MAGTLETMALQTEGAGTLKLLKEEGAGTAVDLCGRLSHELQLGGLLRCPFYVVSHINLFTKQS